MHLYLTGEKTEGATSDNTKEIVIASEKYVLVGERCVPLAGS